MANEEQLNIIRQGRAVWNQWRKDNPKTSVELSSADLSNVDLQSFDLSRANLAVANLTGANLKSANLQGAMLGKTNMNNADLTEANLTGAFLNEANLGTARGVTQPQIDSTNTVDDTILPAGIKGRLKTTAQKLQELSILGGKSVVIGTEIKEFHEVVKDGDFRTVQMHLSRGTDPNVRSKDGLTPLHLAVDAGNKEIIELLVSFGANPNIIASSRTTPLELAQRLGDAQIFSLLKQASTQIIETLKVSPLPATQLVEMIDETTETDGQRLWELSVTAQVSAQTYGEKKFIKELIQAAPRSMDGKTRAEIIRKRGQILLAFGSATAEVSKRYLKATEASLLREALLGGGCGGFFVGFIPSMFAIGILYRIIAGLLPNANTTDVALADRFSSETVLFAAIGFLVGYFILWSIVGGIRYSKHNMSESRKKISNYIVIIIIIAFHCFSAFLLALAN